MTCFPRRSLLQAVLATGLAACAGLPSPALAAPAHTTGAKRPPRPTHPSRAPRHKAAAKPSSPGPLYGHRADVQALAQRLAAQFGLSPTWTEATLAQARYQRTVTQLIMPPPAGATKNWAAYRARFVEAERIRAGLAFWQAHAVWLASAEARYGVPPEVVVGIIGVETFYGRVTGQFRVLDALATLSLDFPSGRSDRSPFFQDELGQYLALCQRQGSDPLATLGSFAGAIGLGQFMPGSINRFAVDFDGDGLIDMAHSAADVIGSVAHYLAEHGWQAGLATHFAVQPPTDTSARAALLLPDIRPSFSAAQLQAQGAVLDEAGRAHTGALALIELQNGETAAPSHLAGTANFYAVTRYNWSAYYALAVIELGQAVAAARRAGP